MNSYCHDKWQDDRTANIGKKTKEFLKEFHKTNIVC